MTGFIVPIYEGLFKGLGTIEKELFQTKNFQCTRAEIMGHFLRAMRIFMIYDIVFKKDSISSIQNENFVENF